MKSRREFLGTSLLFSAAAMAGVAGAPRFAFGRSGTGKTLVKVFMPGGADGLELFPMVGDRHYQMLRPNISWDAPGNGDKSALTLGSGARAMNPHLAPLQEIWSDGRMMISPATALPEANRSHFDCQRWIGAGLKSDTADGYLNRYLSQISNGDHVLRGAVLGKTAMSSEMRGDAHVPSIVDIDRFQLQNEKFCENAGCEDNRLTDMLRDVALPETSLSDAERLVREEQQVLLETIEEASLSGDTEGDEAPYSKSTLGRGLRLVSRLLKAGVPLEVASLDWRLGWDSHARQGGTLFTTGLQEGATDLLTFYRDLGPKMDDVVVLLGTEFGRTIRENGSRGTDHGRAGAWFAFGGNVRPGMADDVPTLDETVLGETARYGLPALVDYRDLVGEIMVRHMGMPENMVPTMFPDHKFRDHRLIRDSAA